MLWSWDAKRFPRAPHPADLRHPHALTWGRCVHTSREKRLTCQEIYRPPWAITGGGWPCGASDRRLAHSLGSAQPLLPDDNRYDVVKGRGNTFAALAGYIGAGNTSISRRAPYDQRPLGGSPPRNPRANDAYAPFRMDTPRKLPYLLTLYFVQYADLLPTGTPTNAPQSAPHTDSQRKPDAVSPGQPPTR